MPMVSFSSIVAPKPPSFSLGSRREIVESIFPKLGSGSEFHGRIDRGSKTETVVMDEKSNDMNTGTGPNTNCLPFTNLKRSSAATTASPR